MKAKNRVDNYYFLVYGIIFSMMIIGNVLILYLHAGIGFVIFGICSFIVTLGYIYLFVNRKYQVTKTKLIVKEGFFKYNYKLSDVKKCFITNSNALSYATARKRICIVFKDKKRIFISPQEIDDLLLVLIKNTGGKN